MKEDFKKELENIAPNLMKIKKQQPAEKADLPANFFHNMQLDVLNQVKSESAAFAEKPKVVHKNWFSFLQKPQISLAFGIGLMLLVAGVFLVKNTAVEPLQMAELTEEEVLEYIAQNIEDFDAVSLTEISEEYIDFEIDLDEEELDLFLEESLDQIDEADFENLF